jgi:hypothetical protein
VSIQSSYYRVLPYLADTVIELGSDESAHTRWFEIKKCRVQDYHEGKHPLRLLDSLGAIIYPALASRRSSLRGRARITPSQHWMIPYRTPSLPAASDPGAQPAARLRLVISEKSSTLILGPQGSGKTLVAMRLLTEASTLRLQEKSQSRGKADRWVRPQNVMVITFRSSEKNFEQAVQNRKGSDSLVSNWRSIPQKWVRWYSPGSNLTAEQIVSEIWRYFKDSRRKGVPVDRILFDETEVAADVLPALQRDSLFWPTILELTATEAATSFFVCENDNDSEEHSAMQLLRRSMDNILRVSQVTDTEKGEAWRFIEPVQHLEPYPLASRIEEKLELSASEAKPQAPEKKAAEPEQSEAPPAE